VQRSPTQPASVDELVVQLATVLALVLAAGLLCCLALAFAEAVAAAVARAPSSSLISTTSIRGTRGSWSCPLTPQWSRRVVFALCGVSMMAPAIAVAAPLGASEHRRPDSCSDVCRSRIDALPLPDLPATPGHRDIPATVHIVERGECLWSIARQHLRSTDSRADLAATARFVRRLYVTNRTVIGSDPDLIFPGTALIDPEAPA
jgi:hypothetical protein